MGGRAAQEHADRLAAGAREQAGRQTPVTQRVRRAASAAPAHRQGNRSRPFTFRLPRRVSGPAVQRQPLPARTLAFIQALPDHPLLDRLVRGPAWIALLGVMLAGIVAMQVEVLKLGASMGRSIQLGTYLQGRNENLRASVASLADDQRIMRLAAKQGMLMPAPDAIAFLSPGSAGTVGKALASIQTPSATTFLSHGSSDGAVVSSVPAGAAGDTSGAATAGATSTTGATTSTGATTTGTATSGAASTTGTATGSTGASGSGSSLGTSGDSSASGDASAGNSGAAVASPTTAAAVSGGSSSTQ